MTPILCVAAAGLFWLSWRHTLTEHADEPATPLGTQALAFLIALSLMGAVATALAGI